MGGGDVPVGALRVLSPDDVLTNRTPGDKRTGFHCFPTGTVVDGAQLAHPRQPLYLGVDPGHATVMTVAGLHSPPSHLRPLPADASRAQRGRRAVEARGVSLCQVHNTDLQGLNKSRITRQRLEAFNHRHELKPSDDQLAQTPVHAPSLEGCIAHARNYLSQWEAQEFRAFHPLVRKDRLLRFRYSQRAASKIAAQIRGSVRAVVGPEEKLRGRIVLVWGNGSFGPTSRGHQAAPNKALRHALREHFPIVMCSEYKTSQVCGALGCEGRLRHPPCQDKDREGTIRGLSQCPDCHVTWNRDVSSALAILKIWRHHMTTRSLERPRCFY